MRPEQLGDYRWPSDARLHPDGIRIAFVVSRMDLEQDRYERRIWLWDGTAAAPLTAGPRDSAPRWSPDGDRLAFLRAADEEGAEPQVAILPMAGGEASVVTSFSRGVTALAWAPDGGAIAVIGREWIPELADLDADERKRRPRRITELPYRADNAGWVHDRKAHLYLADPDGTSDPQCLTPGNFNETAPAWHPAGHEIAFLSARHETRGLDPGAQVWTVPVEGGAPAARTEVGQWSEPSYDPAGALYAIGHPDRWSHPAVQPLTRIGDDGSLTPLATHLDRSLLPHAPPLAPGGPQWLADGSAISTLEDEGRVRVVRIQSDGSTEDVLGGDRLVTGVSPRRDGSAFAFTATAPTEPGDLWWWEDGEERRLTDLNAQFTASVPLVSPSRFTIEHEDLEIEGWVYLPPGDNDVPVLFNIHGGPATQYGYGFFDEFQVYAGAGYGVVAINPRGSSGYGTAHMQAVVGRWHEDEPPDIRDLRVAVDVAAASHPRLDTSRMGVMGGSYGGLITVRLLSLDARYRSAVAERGLYSWVSFAGTSDIGPWFDRLYLAAQLPEGADVMWQSSSLAHAHRIETPTLILHSESDFRTPVEQAEQLYVLLRRIGVDTELVRFPSGEGHELSRSGKPRHRRERFEIILDWHGRYLSPS